MKHEVYLGVSQNQKIDFVDKVWEYCTSHEDARVFVFARLRREAMQLYADTETRNRGQVDYCTKDGIQFRNGTMLRFSNCCESAICGSTVDAAFLFHVKPNLKVPEFETFWNILLPHVCLRDDVVFRWFEDDVTVTEECVYLNKEKMRLPKDETQIMS